MSKRDLTGLFNIILSFCKTNSMNEVDIEHLLRCLKNYEYSFPEHLCIHKEGEIIDRQLNKSQDVLQEVMSTKNPCAKISFQTRLVLSFDSCWARININRHSTGDYFTIDFSQADFMDPVNRVYLEDRIDELLGLSTLIFKEGSCVAGLIGVEESVGPINDAEFVKAPPIDWVFWNKNILESIPNQTLSSVVTNARKVNMHEDGSQFWRWTNFGNRLEECQLSAAQKVQKQLSAVIRNLML